MNEILKQERKKFYCRELPVAIIILIIIVILMLKVMANKEEPSTAIQQPPALSFSSADSIISHGNGIYFFDTLKIETESMKSSGLGYRGDSQQILGPVLAVFLSEHPELEIVSICPVTSYTSGLTSGYSETLGYWVICREKSRTESDKLG